MTNPIVELLRQGANDIEIDGTQSQVGPSPDELRDAADEIERLSRIASQSCGVAEEMVERVARALYDHEWETMASDEGFAEDIGYWRKAAVIALKASTLMGED